MKRVEREISNNAQGGKFARGPTEADMERMTGAICKSRKFETGEGTCAPICMDQLGQARRNCQHKCEVHGFLARVVYAALVGEGAPTDNKGGFEDRNGENVRAGDRVVYMITGQVARMDEALQDGEAFVTFDDGKHGAVKWRNLVKVK